MRRIVKPGLVTEDSAEIAEGLWEGQLVVVSGQETLEDGVKVAGRE